MSNELAVKEQSNVAVIPIDATQSDRLMAALVSATSDPSTDVDKMSKAFDLYEKVAARDARLAYSNAMALTQAAIPAIAKTKLNKQTHSPYADLGAILTKVLPIAGGNGLSLSFKEVDALAGYVKVVGTCSHKDGHSEDFPLELALDGAGMKGNTNKTPIQAKASSITYARRYVTAMIFAVPTEDNDGNKVSTPPPAPLLISAEQVKDLKDRLFNTESDVAGFCKRFQISSVDQLPAQAYGTADAAIKQKEAKNG